MPMDDSSPTASRIAGDAPAAGVDEAMASRRSVRGFKDTPVPRKTVEEILALASRAPSGTNMQPWRVYVAAGETKRQISDAIVEAYMAVPGLATGGSREWKYYPDEFFEPYASRRKKVGLGLYRILGIGKGEIEKMRQARARNYTFFGAPVGLIFTIDRRLQIGSWLDYGMFLQNIMLAARARGLHTCPQAAFADFHGILRKHLPITDEETVICGMALGFLDPDEPANRLETERAPVTQFATFSGF